MASYNDTNGVLEIDLGVISRNYINIKNSLKKKVCCAAVVKANAYGLGIKPVSKILIDSGCRVFFVANMLEGKALRSILRKNNINEQTEVYILHGPTEKNLITYKKFNLQPVINSIYQLNKWKEYSLSKNFKSKIALHFDSGMNRLGLTKDEVDILKKNKNYLSNLNISLLMSHLSCSEEPNNPINYQQKEYFEKVARFFPDSKKSLANSGGTLLNDDFHFDMVRPGYILYAGRQALKSDIELNNSIKLTTHIISINEINEKDAVGYGATFKPKKKTIIGTIPIGYADGYPRSLSNSGFAYINNIRVKIIGRISMDLTVIDLTGVKAEIGSEVILFDNKINLNELAEKGSTISYELMTSLGKRYKRIYNKKNII